MRSTGGLPHDSWARQYDRVLEETFGADYADFTERTLEAVCRRLRPPASVVDFGAGTGRLAVPLARLGYSVTAVDPAPAMLEELARKPEGERVRRVVGGIEEYRGAGDHDLALCVFTVLAFLLDERALEGAAEAMARAVRPGGALLLEIPERDTFQGFDIESARIHRSVEVRPAGHEPDLYAYAERTTVSIGGVPVSHEDAFPLRYWPVERVVRVLEHAGWNAEEDLTDDFQGWGGTVLWLRTVSPKRTPPAGGPPEPGGRS